MIVIPENVKRLKNGYFIDQRFKSSVDPYDLIYNNIKLMYSPEDGSNKLNQNI